MAKFYLQNHVKLASAEFLPGSLVDSAVGDPIQQIENAGGLLVPETVALVALAAGRAMAARAGGASVAAMESIMAAAAGRYGTAAAVGWQAQPEWYIDEVNGNDENDGSTASSPIRTFNELRRRVAGRLTAPQIDVYLLSDITEQIIVDFEAMGPAVWLHGTRKLLYSGSVTGYQALNTATDTEARITDSALPVGWAASGLENKLIVLTSGTHAGATGYLGSDLGGKTALFQRLLRWGTFDLVEPTVGDTFEVYDQTRVSGGLWLELAGGLFVQDIHFDNPTGWTVAVNHGQLIAIWCSITGAAYGVSDWADLYSSFLSPDYAVIERGAYSTIFFGSMMRPRNSGISLHAGALLELNDGVLIDGKDATTYGGITIGLGGFMVAQYDPIGFVRFPAGSKPLVVQSGGAVRFKADVWGLLGNAPDHWLWINSGGVVVLSAGVSLHAKGSAVSDVLVGTKAATNAEATAGWDDTTTGARTAVEVF